jgi:two-component system alkaline phosphatase synthesis response regulator PhoP
MVLTPLLDHYALESLRPDLILLDLVMPGQSGNELLPKLLDLKLSPTPVIFIMSMRSHVERVKNSIGLGADGYLVKPIPATVVKHLWYV